MLTTQTSKDMTKRITVSIDDDVYQAIEEWAKEEIRTTANLAAAMLTFSVRERQEKSVKTNNKEE